MIIYNSRNSGKTKSLKEKIIENHLKFFKFYQIGIKNCQQQLDYIMPSLVATYGATEKGSFWFIPNNTENVALDRLESKTALDLKEEIERFKLITNSVENAVAELTEIEKQFVHLRYFESKPMAIVTNALGYAEEKSVYRIRRHVLDKLLISLNNLLIF